MPSALDTLIGRIADEQLRADIRAAVSDLRKVTDFGLVFEAHIPETVRLPHHSIRRGVKVTRRDLTDQSMFEVAAVNKTAATIRRLRHPDGVKLAGDDKAGGQPEKVAVSSLVALAEFGDAIYPGLRHLGSVTRGGDRAAHVVINGENHHVLEALRFSHAGKIDCIYIDPPYNSGARDWKYNNDYVDGEDVYRHSKWLAFMNRRIQLAKELLNPDDSVLIVAIDEKEYLRLGLLLEQLFPTATIQMVSSVVKPGGTSRTKEFSRVEEYLFFVFVGAAEVQRTGDNMLSALDGSAKLPLAESDLWEGMIRRGIGVVRSQRPKQFYPIYIDAELRRIVSAGPPLPLAASRATVDDQTGLVTVWPIKDDGTEGFWQLSPAGLEKARARGTVRVGGFNAKTDQWRIQYMKARKAKAVDEGAVATLGKDENGVLIVDLSGSSLTPESTPRTVWNRPSHDASVGGAGLLNKLLPGRKFPFPKSLYAVEDSLRFFIRRKPDAVILDFFAGSGTTAHAVARLNRQDEGHRQSISVTNNEVSGAEAETLRAQGLKPGDPKWEELGIFEYVTRPRITAAVTGIRPDDKPIEGDYKFVDESPMADGFDENFEFFELTYLDAAQIEVDLAFAGIAPLLWLRAGARGPIIDACRDAAGRRKPYAWTEQYGILFKTDRWRSFVSKRPDAVTAVYVVTDSITEFSHIAGELPGHLDVVRLYERYLTTFAVNGR
jgi:adenine-specific DNA-methyltransferase